MTTPHPYDRTTHDGKTVDWLTHAALQRVEARLGYPLTITQGSYNAGGVSASAGTHDGGGVVDLDDWNHDDKVRELRRVGFAAWFRPGPPAFSWTPHIHAVLIGNARLSPAARAQVAEYLAGYDGLAGDGRDQGPRQYVGHRFTWQTGTRRIGRARQLLKRARALLSHKVRGYPRVVRALRSLDVTIEKLPKGEQ